ncbi:MAG: YlbF family regulator [Bacillota bacterium]
MSVYDQAHRLAREIKDSDEYNNYLNMREQILNSERSCEMLKDYQQKQMELQGKQMSGENLTDEEKEKMEKLREIIELNLEIRDYLNAEYRVSQMINDLQEILFSDLKLGVLHELEDEEKHPE